jgi:hypothetical protein
MVKDQKIVDQESSQLKELMEWKARNSRFHNILRSLEAIIIT